jgi:hypothetical protein
LTLNNSTGVAGALDATIEGVDASAFGIDGTSCGARIPACGSCDVTVHFKPTRIGFASATLRASSAGGNTAVTLSGTGLAPPVLTINPDDNQFACAVDGALANFKVTNAGPTDGGALFATLGGVDGGAFAFVTDDCKGRALVVNDSCDIKVRLASKGRALGDLNATLDVFDSTTMARVSAKLGATVVPASNLTVDFSAFGSVRLTASSAPRTFVVRNAGAATTTALTVDRAGSHRTDFAIGNNTCQSVMLAAGATCTIDLTFTPGRIGSRAACLIIAGMAGSSGAAPLVGMGVP